MKRTAYITLAAVLLLILVIGVAQAQSDDKRGTIQGLVYEDVNGDGKCVNTGVEGEGPVEGVDIEFASSDEKTIITLYSGPEGIYGLFAAGSSYWRVTAKPDSDWVVTSENPLWAPLDDDNQVVTDVNFCVRNSKSAAVYLPAAGGPNKGLVTLAASIGAFFVLSGLALEWRRRQSA